MKKIGSIILIAMLCLALFGCGRTTFVYKNADKYTMGGSELGDKIEALEIEWIDGSVTVEYHSESTVKFSETSKQPLIDDAVMRWWLDGTTLHLKYAASNVILPSGLNKHLTVYIPENFEFESVEISTVSGSISFEKMSAKTAELSAVSGSVDASGSAGNLNMSSVSGTVNAEFETKTATLENISGNINFSAMSDIENLKIQTVSGFIDARTKDINNGKIETTSGKLTFECEKAGEKLDISSVSGTITVDCTEVPSILDLETVSGNINLSIPENSGMTATIDTVSGKINTEIAMTINGSKYICGDGSSTASIETVSGRVTIRAKD